MLTLSINSEVIRKTCKYCSKQFLVETNNPFAEAVRYCCDECYSNGRKRQLKRQFAGLNKGRK